MKTTLKKLHFCFFFFFIRLMPDSASLSLPLHRCQALSSPGLYSVCWRLPQFSSLRLSFFSVSLPLLASLSNCLHVSTLSVLMAFSETTLFFIQCFFSFCQFLLSSHPFISTFSLSLSLWSFCLPVCLCLYLQILLCLSVKFFLSLSLYFSFVFSLFLLWSLQPAPPALF